MELAPQSVDAVMLAGGINTISLYEGYEPGYKALLEVGGQPCIRYVIDALKGSRYVRRVGIVGSEADLKPVVGNDVTAFAPPSESLLGSIMQAWSLFGDAPLVLTTVADLPLLKPQMVDDFLEACAGAVTTYKENAFLAVVSEEHFTSAFANLPKGGNVFKDGTVCHGNLLLATPRLLDNEAARARVNAVYAGRKSPIKSALAFGLGLGLAYVFGVHLFHLFTLKRMTDMASRRFGFGVVPILLPHPQVAVDVDEPKDYELVQRCLAS